MLGVGWKAVALRRHAEEEIVRLILKGIKVK